MLGDSAAQAIVVGNELADKLVQALVKRHGARDTTQRGTALPELDMLTPRNSQHLPGLEVPEKHWMYRFAKKHYYFGFGAYT